MWTVNPYMPTERMGVHSGLSAASASAGSVNCNMRAGMAGYQKQPLSQPGKAATAAVLLPSLSSAYVRMFCENDQSLGHLTVC